MKPANEATFARVECFGAAVLSLTILAAGAAVDEKAYVQEGLYAQYDGIVNAGYDAGGNGVHSPDTNGWYDISGNGHHLADSSGATTWTWDANALHLSKGSIKPHFVGELDYTSLTLDFYLTHTNISQAANTYLFFTASFYYDEAAKKWRDPNVLISGSKFWANNSATSSGLSRTWANGGHVVVHDGYGFWMWQQGDSIPSSSQTLSVLLDSSGSRTFYVNSSSAANSQFNGSMHTLRIYSRPLTAAEVEWNNAIDRVRFGSGSVSHALSVISSAGSNYATSTPAYGSPSVVEGTEKTFSISGLVDYDGGVRAAQLGDGVRARFDGWRYVKGREGTSLYDELSGSDETVALTVEYLVSTFAWQFVREVEVSAVAVNGSVSMNGAAATSSLHAWCSDSYTLTAVPDAGYAFSMWAGSTAGIEDISSPEITVPPDVARTLTAVFVASSRDPVTWRWQGGASGNWGDPANWGGGVPITGDSVVLEPNEDVTVVVMGQVPRLNSVTIGNTGSGKTTVELHGWDQCFQADEIHVATGGCIAVSGAHVNSASETNRVWIAADVLTVDAGGEISADAAGFIGTNGPCWKVVFAERQTFHSNDAGYLWGAAYGGEQGYETDPSHLSAPAPYGSLTAPTDLGAGGNRWDHPGGGAIRLEISGKLTVNGRISADADKSLKKTSGGHAVGFGTGGSVWINCRTLEGNGEISASSGSWYASTASSGMVGGSSGGRIAVHYDSVAQASAVCAVRLLACGGVAYAGSDRLLYAGHPGTVWATDNRIFSANRVSGEWHSGEGGNLTLAGGTWTNPHLAFRDRAITIDGDLSLAGEAAGAFGLFLSNVVLTVQGDLTLGGARLETRGGKVKVEGDLQQTSTTPTVACLGGDILVLSMPTNDPSVSAGAELEVSGHWNLAAGTICWPTCHPVNGSIPKFSAHRLTVAENASINADLRGYGPGRGPGRGTFDSVNIIDGGAGHGGYGGGTRGVAGGPYDSETDPKMPGSGTHSYQNNAKKAGGVVYLRIADKLTVDGTISADASADAISTQRTGGSSGGAINIWARRILGKGRLTALGGAKNSKGGNGSGGRIAIYASPTSPWWGDTTEHVSVAIRPSGFDYSTLAAPAYEAEAGTIFWSKLPNQGFTIFVR